MKIALITGVTGQDGSYLAEFLLKKGYQVHGVKRRSSSFNTVRIDHLIRDYDQSFKLHFGDLSDSSSVIKLIDSIKPDEIYNLGAQSHVAVSFEMPEYTADVNGLGALRILEAIRFLDASNSTRFYQASSSELFGLVQEVPQTETTPFYPRSPYAVAKLFAYWTTVNYREAYGIYGCNGILYNHESERRGETFVTRKITRGLTLVALGLDSEITLGNLDAKRDWGYAADYVEMQWLMLQQSTPKDYIISTGRQSTVREFLNLCFKELNLTVVWEGNGVNEIAKVIGFPKEFKVQSGQVIVRVDPKYFRPAEVDSLLGDSSLAHKELGWQSTTSLEKLVKNMITSDLKLAKASELLLKAP